MELVFALSALLDLGRMDEADKLARSVPRALQYALDPSTETMLMRCLAEYHSRKGNWNKAIKLLEFTQFDPTFNQNAVIGIVEIRAAQALLALQQGFELIEQFNHNTDPESETTLPGNEDAIQQDAIKKFRRLQKILEKILPKGAAERIGD